MLSSLRFSAPRSIRRFNALNPTSRLAFAQPFSSTPRNDVNALFKMTENEELNTILREIQDKIILPSYLPETQRRMVFDFRRKNYLETNPIDIEVEGYEHRFKYINAKQDVPKTQVITDQAMQAMKTREDFDNLGTLLAGLKHASQALKPNRVAKVYRLMLGAGQVGALIGCLKQFRETGLTVPSKQALVRLYEGLNKEAREAEGDIEKLQQVVRWSDIVQDVIQRPEHDALLKNHHDAMNRYANKQLAGADENLQLDLAPVFSTHSLRDLHASVFGRSLALYPRLALVNAKQAAGEDVEADMVKLNDEIETASALWHARQVKDAETFDFDRVVEVKQLCPTMNPRGNLWKWLNNVALSDIQYQNALGELYNVLREAEAMSPTQARGLAAVADQIPAHVAKLMQIVEAKVVEPVHESRNAEFKELTGIDVVATMATLPPLENHRLFMGVDPELLPEAELEEGAAIVEEVVVEEGASKQ